MKEERLKELLRGEATATEREAEERGWAVVRAAYDERPSPAARRPRRSLALALAGAATLLGLVMSPAGADVREWIEDVVEPGVERAQPSLSSLPTEGRLLVETDVGVWAVERDGAQRLLGDYREAVWSARGAFAAVTRGPQLVAVVADADHPLAAGQPAGTVRWTVSGEARISDPAWAPSGFRVAYRDGADLHVVAGDGSGDALLARGVAPVPAVWRPLAQPPALESSGRGTHVLAYLDNSGEVVVRDVDSGRVLERAEAGAGPRQLLWAPDGRSVIALGRDTVSVIDVGGAPDSFAEADGTARFRRAALLGGDRLAILATFKSPEGTVRSTVTVWRLKAPASPRQDLFAGPGRISDLVASPDGRWLLLGWRDADQWLFVRPGAGRPHAVSNIARQFDPGGKAPAFPSVSGWCCG